MWIFDTFRELKEMGQRCGMCAALCHISRQKVGGPRRYLLRIASVGEAKAVLSRTTGSLTLAHTPSQVNNMVMFLLYRNVYSYFNSTYSTLLSNILLVSMVYEACF